jgi:soluble lytic murein transglycosylase-like protein
MAVQTKPIRKTRSTTAMTAKTATKPRASKRKNRETASVQSSSFIRLLPGWIIIGFVLVILLPHALSATLSAAGHTITDLPRTVGVSPSNNKIAPMFSSSVNYWANHIAEWAALYNLDPNLLATIMQIESCGDAQVSSYAGAQGLFQVMPFHFSAGENQLDPDTNAMRGASFLNECLGYANDDAGLAMACYNGGPSVVSKPYAAWPDQTQRYFRWGTTIYNDARQNMQTSDSLATWLNAGGSALCQRAAASLGISG